MLVSFACPQESGDNGERAHRRAGAAHELERRGDQDRAFGRQLVEIAKARQAVTIGLVDKVVRREGRIHAAGRARIRADGFRSPADDVLRQEIFDCLRGRPWRMRTLVVSVEECLSRPVALVPVGAQHHPTAGLDAAMLTLPFFYAVGSEHIVRILRGFLRAIDDADGRDEVLDGDSIGRAVLIILAGDPVHGRVEMRAGVLAELEPAPRPKWSVLIVMRDLVHFHRRGVLANLRRQKEHRRVGPERSSEVDDLDRPRQQGGGEIRKDLVRAHLYRSWTVSSRHSRSVELIAGEREPTIPEEYADASNRRARAGDGASAYPHTVQALRATGIGRTFAPLRPEYMHLAANRGDQSAAWTLSTPSSSARDTTASPPRSTS